MYGWEVGDGDEEFCDGGCGVFLVCIDRRPVNLWDWFMLCCVVMG